MRVLLLLFALVCYALASESRQSFYQCAQYSSVKHSSSGRSSIAHCLEGFYEVPDFFIFKGGYVYVFAHDEKLYAYGVGNLDGSAPAPDRYNPDKLLRTRLDRWVVFLRDLVIEENGGEYRLRSGFSYNFQNGSTYYTKGNVLENGDLDLDFSLDSFHIFGKGFIWRRMSQAEITKRGLRSISPEAALATIPATTQQNPEK